MYFENKILTVKLLLISLIGLQIFFVEKFQAKTWPNIKLYEEN